MSQPPVIARRDCLRLAASLGAAPLPTGGRTPQYGRLTKVTSETTPATGIPGPTRALEVGMGAGALATADMVLNIGPQHPATQRHKHLHHPDLHNYNALFRPARPRKAPASRR